MKPHEVAEQALKIVRDEAARQRRRAPGIVNRLELEIDEDGEVRGFPLAFEAPRDTMVSRIVARLEVLAIDAEMADG